MSTTPLVLPGYEQLVHEERVRRQHANRLQVLRAECRAAEERYQDVMNSECDEAWMLDDVWDAVESAREAVLDAYENLGRFLPVRKQTLEEMEEMEEVAP